MALLKESWLFWALLSALFAGATAILAKIGCENINSNLATAIRTTVILLFSWGIASSVISAETFSHLSKKTWLFLILSGVATGLSWLCYFRALQLGQASQVAPIDKLSVIFAILLAAWFLHEPVTWHHWTGGSFIVLGAIILTWR
jgi:transporter family protein